MCKFNEKDVVTVANAILDGHMHFDHTDTQDYGWSCSFCDAGDPSGGGLDGRLEAVEASKKVIHEVDCAVLVAQDLLTKTDK